MLAWPLHPAQSRLGRYIALPGYIQSATHCTDGRTVGLPEMHPGAGQRTETALLTVASGTGGS